MQILHDTLQLSHVTLRSVWGGPLAGTQPAVGTSPAWLPRRLPGRPKRNSRPAGLGDQCARQGRLPSLSPSRSRRDRGRLRRAAERRAGAGDGELGDVTMTQHPALPTGTMPMRKNVTRQADWGMAGAARRRLGELRAEPRRGGRKDAGKGAASDAHMGSNGAEGAHTRLPAQVQLGRRRRAALRSRMSMPAASTASLDLHGHTRRGDECTREVQRLASVNRCGQCVA